MVLDPEFYPMGEFHNIRSSLLLCALSVEYIEIQNQVLISFHAWRKDTMKFKKKIREVNYLNHKILTIAKDNLSYKPYLERFMTKNTKF